MVSRNQFAVCRMVPVKIKESFEAWRHLHWHSWKHLRYGICQNKRVQWPAFKLLMVLAVIPMVLTFWHVKSLLYQDPSEQYCFVSTKGDYSFNIISGIYAKSSDNNQQKRRFVRVPLETLANLPYRWPSVTSLDHHVSTIFALSSQLQQLRVMGSYGHLPNTGPGIALDFDVQQNQICFLPLKSQLGSDHTNYFKGICVDYKTWNASPVPSHWSASRGEMHLPGTLNNKELDRSESHSNSIAIFCPSTASSNKQSKKKRKKPNRKLKARKGQKLIQAFMEKPTTHLLIGLNLVLAFYYWNYSTPIQSVAKIYSRIMDAPFEPWRAFSGALAHFDLMHIGFNMMTLYGMGMSLEQTQMTKWYRPYSPSLSFLCYNIALVIWTSVTLMGLKKIQVYWMQMRRGDTAGLEIDMIQNGPTIGYSGVLFSWMVIETLERSETCPIPFLPDICFETHEFLNIKWNLGPIVTLGITQLILRRASFVGHLAGILCGYAIHIGLLPYKLMIVPHVLLPLVLLWYYGFIYHVIGPVFRTATALHPPLPENFNSSTIISPVVENLQSDADEEQESLLMEEIPYRNSLQAVSGLQSSRSTTSHLSFEVDGGAQNSLRRKFKEINPVNLRTWSLLHVTCQMQLVIIVICILWNHQGFDLTLSLFLSWVWLCLVVQSYDFVLFSKYNHDEEDDSFVVPKKETVKEYSLVVTRVWFLCTLIVLINNTMTLSTWMSCKDFLLSVTQAQNTQKPASFFAFAFERAVLLQFITVSLQSFQLVLASKIIHDMSREVSGSGVITGGVFDTCLGWAYRPFKQIADQVLVRELIAFDGNGVALGGGMDSPNVI